MEFPRSCLYHILNLSALSLVIRSSFIPALLPSLAEAPAAQYVAVLSPLVGFFLNRSGILQSCLPSSTITRTSRSDAAEHRDGSSSATGTLQVGHRRPSATAYTPPPHAVGLNFNFESWTASQPLIEVVRLSSSLLKLATSVFFEGSHWSSLLQQLT